MFKKLFNKRVLLITFIMLLFLAIPSSFAEDSSTMDMADNSHFALGVSDVSLVDSQSDYQSSCLSS